MGTHYLLHIRKVLPLDPRGRKPGNQKNAGPTYLLPPLLPLLPKRKIRGKGGIEGAGRKVLEVAVEVVRW